MIATVLFYFALVFLAGLFLTSLVATGDKGRGVESLSEKAMKFNALIFFAAAVAKFIFAF